MIREIYISPTILSSHVVTVVLDGEDIHSGDGSAEDISNDNIDTSDDDLAKGMNGGFNSNGFDVNWE